MSDPTEREILSALKDTLSRAIQHCEDLCRRPQFGDSYTNLRQALIDIERYCRQIAMHQRGDARWLQIGLAMNRCHRTAGDWLRGHMPRKLFMMLSDNMRGLVRLAEQLETKRTGRMGVIVPKPLRGPIKSGRHVTVMLPGERKTASGLIIPA